jgi:hypothetical protein
MVLCAARHTIAIYGGGAFNRNVRVVVAVKTLAGGKLFTTDVVIDVRNVVIDAVETGTLLRARVIFEQIVRLALVVNASRTTARCLVLMAARRTLTQDPLRLVPQYVRDVGTLVRYTRITPVAACAVVRCLNWLHSTIGQCHLAPLLARVFVAQ